MIHISPILIIYIPMGVCNFSEAKISAVRLCLESGNLFGYQTLHNCAFIEGYHCEVEDCFDIALHFKQGYSIQNCKWERSIPRNSILIIMIITGTCCNNNIQLEHFTYDWI